MILVTLKTLYYSSKERLIALLVIPPVAITMNFFVFGAAYFDSLHHFLLPSLVTSTVVLILYILFSMIATIMLNRFPKYSQVFKKIGIEILCFISITAVAVTVLFYGYDYIGIEGMPVKMENYVWVLITGVVCNLLSTSFNEGVA